MRKSIVLIFLSLMTVVGLPIVSYAELPDKKAYAYEWQSYTKKILLKLLPNDLVVAEEIGIVILEDQTVDAFGDYEYNRIRITRGMINMLTSESELAFVLTHEYAHIMLKHQEITGDYSSPPDYELWKKQELEADKEACKIITIHYNPCALVGFLKRLSDPNTFPPAARNLARVRSANRLAVARSYCHPK